MNKAYSDSLKLAKRDLEKAEFTRIAKLAGGELRTNFLLLPYMIYTLKIDTNTLEVSFLDSSQEVNPKLKILTLHYLRDAKDIKPSGKLISFKEVPSGMSYYPSFHARTERLLLQRFGNDLSSFKEICERLGGVKCNEGDICYRIRTFPLLSLTFMVWEGDEEFPPNISILFDETSSKHLLPEDLAVLTELLCEEMISLRKD